MHFHVFINSFSTVSRTVIRAHDTTNNCASNLLASLMPSFPSELWPNLISYAILLPGFHMEGMFRVSHFLVIFQSSVQKLLQGTFPCPPSTTSPPRNTPFNYYNTLPISFSSYANSNTCATRYVSSVILWSLLRTWSVSIFAWHRILRNLNMQQIFVEWVRNQHGQNFDFPR